MVDIRENSFTGRVGRGCSGQEWSPHPWGNLKPCGGDTWGHGSGVALAVLGMLGLNELGDISQPKPFRDSLIL